MFSAILFFILTIYSFIVGMIPLGIIFLLLALFYAGQYFRKTDIDKFDGAEDLKDIFFIKSEKAKPRTKIKRKEKKKSRDNFKNTLSKIEDSFDFDYGEEEPDEPEDDSDGYEGEDEELF